MKRIENNTARNHCACACSVERAQALLLWYNTEKPSVVCVEGTKGGFTDE